MSDPTGMPLTAAVALVRDRRGPEDVAVSSMGSAREWMALGPLLMNFGTLVTISALAPPNL